MAPRINVVSSATIMTTLNNYNKTVIIVFSSVSNKLKTTTISTILLKYEFTKIFFNETILLKCDWLGAIFKVYNQI